MSEIEKMYENAGIKPYIYCSKPQLDCNAREIGNCKQDCEYYSGERLLTPFTAEKQINLTQKLWELKPNVYPNFDLLTNYSYSEMIAELANHLWQDLTEEEKQQVKGILE